MPTISGIDHIALTVSNLAVSVAFYESVLGVRPVAAMTDGSFTRYVLPLPGGTHLGLTPHDPVNGRSFDATTPGLDHLGLGLRLTRTAHRVGRASRCPHDQPRRCAGR